MSIDVETILLILGLVVLTAVLTGPGLWSEKWGWRLWSKKPKKDERRFH